MRVPYTRSQDCFFMIYATPYQRTASRLTGDCGRIVHLFSLPFQALLRLPGGRRA